MNLKFAYKKEKKKETIIHFSWNIVEGVEVLNPKKIIDIWEKKFIDVSKKNHFINIIVVNEIWTHNQGVHNHYNWAEFRQGKAKFNIYYNRALQN